MTAIPDSDPLGEGGGTQQDNCFICWRSQSSLEPLFKSSRLNPPKSFALKSQLSVIFLLRRVLGVHPNVLAKVLEDWGGVGGGNPDEWGVKLCGSCHLLFREAEFVFRRLIKFQADFQHLAKELRDLLLASVEGVTDRSSESLPGRVKRRKPGRPPGKKKCDDKPEDIEGCPTSGSKSVAEYLRNKFVETWNSEDGQLEVSPPQVLFTTHGTDSILDSIQTTQPIQVRVTQNHFQISRVSPSSKPCPDPPPSKRSDANPTSSKRGKKVTFHDQVEKDLSENTSLIIKREIISGEFHNETETDTYFDNHIEIDDSMPSPPAADEDMEWVPDDDAGSDQDGDPIGNKDDAGDSDYQPESEPKKKDRRFTRKKPNVKENLRKKENRDRKAASFEKVALGVNVEPVVEQVDKSGVIYGCPQEGCEQKFEKKFDCHVHVLRDHYEDPMPYHCHVCDKKRFDLEKSLRKHMVRFHHEARCPYDEDYDPELHSAEKLKSAVEEDEVWKTFRNVIREDGGRDSEHSSDDEGVPGVPSFPNEVLQKFKDTKDTIFRCRHEPCKRKFLNEMLRDGHEKRIHQGIDKPFQCEHCKKSFIRRTRLLEHLALSHYSNQVSCHHCGARFADKVLLAGHIGRAHLGDNTPFKCTSCPMTFARRTRMDVHMYKKHGTPLPNYPQKRRIPARSIPLPKIVPSKAKKTLEGEELGLAPIKRCWVCHTPDGTPLLFDTPEDLKEHLEEKHNNTGQEKPFKCPVPKCLKEYRTNGKLDCHIVNVHNGQIVDATPGEFRCSHCDETFHRNYLLDAHMARQHNVSNYMCNFCAKQFRTQRYLEDHQRQTHYKELNIDPHKCRLCGKVMNTKKSLDHHIRMLHTKDTPFNCTVPGCTFGTMYRSTMNVHMNIKHSNRQNAICPICSRTFAAQFYLNRHMRVHTGEKPYKCSTCGKLFSDLPTYNRHVEAHLGKIHKCPLVNCGKEYITRHAWRCHLKQHKSRGDPVEVPNFRYLPTKTDMGEGDEEEETPSTSQGDNADTDSKLPVLEREGCSSSMDGMGVSGNEDSLSEIRGPPPLQVPPVLRQQPSLISYQSVLGNAEGEFGGGNGDPIAHSSTVDLKPLF